MQGRTGEPSLKAMADIYTVLVSSSLTSIFFKKRQDTWGIRNLMFLKCAIAVFASVALVFS
jgi:hypothetical protein